MQELQTKLQKLYDKRYELYQDEGSYIYAPDKEATESASKKMKKINRDIVDTQDKIINNK